MHVRCIIVSLDENGKNYNTIKVLLEYKFKFILL